VTFVSVRIYQLTINPFTPFLTDKDFRVWVMERVETAAAKVVVGGGRGVGSAAGFRALEELAGLLGGAVDCSWAVTSLGWRPQCRPNRPDRHADRAGATRLTISGELHAALAANPARSKMMI
jgi:electron transfer flavoprotein alpha subunit